MLEGMTEGTIFTGSEKSDEEDCVELETLNLNWYEKGTDIIIVHLYAKDVTQSSLDFSEADENYVKVNFTTSNEAFVKRHFKVRDGSLGKEHPAKFCYRLYPSGKVSKNGSSCIAKKTLIEVTLQKALPVAFKSLERRDVTIARQTGKFLEWKQQQTCKANANHCNSTILSPSQTKIEPVTTDKERPILSQKDISSKVQLYGKFTKQSQLLGGKSTPISKGEQNNKEKREEGAIKVDDQQPSCSSSADEVCTTQHKPLNMRQEVFGLNGLENFANNCYLNVVVQVLANIFEVKDYFESDSYLQYLNVTNPLGSGGKVARAFSDLIKLLWSGGKKAFKPNVLKTIMGKRCSLFLGFQQCDAQEFFSALLDSLHEDLNQGRIDRGAEYSHKEGDGPTVNERSDTAWQAHLARNNSVIVRMFHGQLVSKLTCASCHKVSHSYDPCAQISLPIAMGKKLLSVILFYKDPKKVPSLLRIQISTVNAQVWHLVNMVSRKVDIPSHHLKAFPVSDGLYQSNLSDHAPLRPMLDKKYVVVCETRGAEEDFLSLPVIQHISGQVEFTRCSFCSRSQDLLGTKLKRCTRCSLVAYCGRDCQSKHWNVHRNECRKDARLQFGLPFIITVKKSSLSFNTFKEALLNYAYYSIKTETFDDAPENILTKESVLVPKEESEVVADSSQNAGATSSSDRNDIGASYFVIRAHPQCKSENETFVLKHDDFKLEKLSAIGLISLDWIAPGGGDAKNMDLKEREPPAFNPWDIASQEERGADDKCTLDDCLSLFMEPERLSESESWRCPKCKTPQAARKEMAISYPPPILLLHLKRFTYGEVGQKVSKPVHYKVSGFDLSPYVVEENRLQSPVPFLYDLVGVICHKGTLRIGHYVCMSRLLDHNDEEDIGWRFMDDEDVARIREEKAVSPEAYVVIYRLRGLSKLFNVEKTLLTPPTTCEDKSSLGKTTLSKSTPDSDPESEARNEFQGCTKEAQTGHFLQPKDSLEDNESKTHARCSERENFPPKNTVHGDRAIRSYSSTEGDSRSCVQSRRQRSHSEDWKSKRQQSSNAEKGDSETYLSGVLKDKDIDKVETAGVVRTEIHMQKYKTDKGNNDTATVKENEEEVFSDCLEHFTFDEGYQEKYLMKPKRNDETNLFSSVDNENPVSRISLHEATAVAIEEKANKEQLPTPTIDQKNVTEEDLD